MNAKKKRDKNRRWASRLAEQAWDAAYDENFDFALKLIRRAVGLNPANPALWNDQGTLLLKLQEDDKAAESFQTAIRAAPDFADAYAGLAAIRARQGRAEHAVTLQREAVRLAPDSARHQNALAAYEALLVASSLAGNTLSGISETQAPGSDDRSEQASGGEPTANSALPDVAARVEALDWPELDGRLTRHSLAHVPGLLGPEECATLRTMFDDERLFAKTVTMNKSRFGRGVYRYFAAPLPGLVDAIRRSVYPRVAEIANGWQRLLLHNEHRPVELHGDEPYPATWIEFRDRCAEAGQCTPSPLLLRYEAGGFNAPHQDIRGEVFFPLQLVVVLSPRADSGTNDASEFPARSFPAGGFTGGEFVFCDQPERKPSDRRAVPAGLGDAVLFCTRARLVRVGGVYGLKPVKHGLDRIASGTRYALGIPFHELE